MTHAPGESGMTLCKLFVPVGTPVATLEKKSTLGDWPDVRIAANPRRPSCRRCQRRLAA